MSTILFGYDPAYHPLLEALSLKKNARPVYLMPGDGRKGNTVRSVPIHPHQINEMTDFALAHQADAVFLLDRISLSRGAADDARAMGLNVIGPTVQALAHINLKALRGAASARGLKITQARAFPDPRSAADKNTAWPCVLLAPDGAERVFRSGGEIKNALNRREISRAGNEWYCAEPFPGERRMISLYRDEKNTVPFLYEEGDGDWIRMASELMESAGYHGFLTLVLRDGDGWALERFDPLPAPGIPWEECLTVLLG